MQGMYTWEGWQDRFRRTLKELGHTAPLELESFWWDWEHDEDPQVTAEVVVSRLNEQELQ